MHQKCQYNSLHQKIKSLCNTLNWGNWNSEFIKLVVRWAERDIGKQLKNLKISLMVDIKCMQLGQGKVHLLLDFCLVSLLA